MDTTCRSTASAAMKSSDYNSSRPVSQTRGRLVSADKEGVVPAADDVEAMQLVPADDSHGDGNVDHEVS